MYNKILTPLDGSDMAECSIRHLTEIASGCRASEVILLKVVEPINPAQFAEAGESFMDKAQRMAKDNALEYVSGLVGQLKKQGLNARGVVREGMPADEILDFVKKDGVDLIVMSTHGRSGISRWTMGSVTDKVVRHSPVPVLTVSPRGCRAS